MAAQATGASREANGSHQADGTPDAQGGTPETFEGWLGKQAEATNYLLEAHRPGLKTSLKSERSNRKGMTAHLKALQAECDPKQSKARVA